MKKLIVLNVFLLTVFSVFSDTLVCKVTDGAQPMSFVSVYLKDSPEIGTVSDMEGVLRCQIYVKTALWYFLLWDTKPWN